MFRVHRSSIVVLAALAVSFVCVPCFAQTLTTTMVGEWQIDVEASIKATSETGNKEALALAKTLPSDVFATFNSNGSFTWNSSTGEWVVKREQKDRLKVVFKSTQFERNSTVIIPSKDVIRFEFRASYPVCVYKRLRKSQP